MEIGNAQLELQLDSKIIENAINRFFICENSLCVNNICVPWTIQNFTFPVLSENPNADSLYVRFDLGWGGAYTGDTILLRLFLDGDHKEQVRLEFVEAESTGLLDWEMFRDFNLLLAYLQLVKPLIFSLPVEDILFGNVHRYYIKVIDVGHVLFGLATDSSLNASDFVNHNSGIITGGVAAHNRFAVSADQEYIKDQIMEVFSSVEEMEIENISFSPLSRNNIEFSENQLKITGGVDYDGPCGLVSVNIDLDYEIKATFCVTEGVLDIQLDIDLDFADLGEKVQAGVCGIISMIWDNIPYPAAILMTPMMTIFGTPIAAALAGGILDDMVARKINLDGLREPGLAMWRVDDNTWRMCITPVGAMGIYGGLVWPLRLVSLSLDQDGRIVLYGDQDAEPNVSGDQEASFSGSLCEEIRGASSFEIDQMEVGSGYHSKVFQIGKDDNALVAICGWQIVDDENHCFSVEDYPALPLGGAVPDNIEVPEIKGTKIVSPQNTIPVTVTFGPHFSRLTGSFNGGPGLRTGWHPGCGEEFHARLRVDYKVRAANGPWENRQQYFDLHGEIISNLSLPGKVHFDPWIEFYMPDDMFQAAAEFEILPDFWSDIPGPNDLDLLCINALDPAVEQLNVCDAEGAILASAQGNQIKSLTIVSNPSEHYNVEATPARGVGEPHFFVNRDCLLYQAELVLDDIVSDLAFIGHILAIANGKNVELYDVHDLQQPIRTGILSFDSQVQTLDTVLVNGQRLFVAADSTLVRTFNVPRNAKESAYIVFEQQRAISTVGIELTSTADVNLLATSQSTLELSEFCKYIGGLPNKELAFTKPIDKAIVTDKWIITANNQGIAVFSQEGESYELITHLSDMPACDSMRLNGTRLFLHVTGGETIELSLKDPTQPTEVARYFAACAERQLLLKGRKAFGIVPDSNRVHLYQRDMRHIERSFTLQQSKLHWEMACRTTVLPVKSRPTDKRFIANSRSHEVHDLNDEKPQCQIDKIILGEHALVFAKDTLAQAHWEGYDNCAFCLGKSLR